jgi:hypothetical protein
MPRAAFRNGTGGCQEERVEEGLVTGEVLAAAMEADGAAHPRGPRAGRDVAGRDARSEPGTAR